MQQYVVKPNDTLYMIAQEFNVPLEQLIRANPQITNPNLIYEGQTVTIPDLPAVPDQIGVLESNAVDIINDIYLSDWQSANNRINTVRTALNELTPLLREAEVPNNTVFELSAVIRSLEQNAMRRSAFPAISQANRITQILADVLDFFNVVIPTDIMRVAYFARQMIVNIEQNDWAEADQNFRRLMTVWLRIRPQLSDSYAQDVIGFEQALNELRGSIDRRDYRTAINNSNRILELNNRLSADFEQMYT